MRSDETRTGRGPLATALLRRKTLEDFHADRHLEDGPELKRSLSLAQLTMLSIGATLGSGIFVILGEAVPVAGPAVVLSFALAGITALFSALSYAELAGMIPMSGSSYSYSYATLGELVAWVCGWCLILEYGVSVASVAVGWGQYLNTLLGITLGVTIPDTFSAPPGDGGVLNVPAIVVVALAMVLLLGGVKESARANAIMVAVKVATLALFCVVAFTAVHAANFTPFLPMGMAGLSAGGAKVFFSYIGFDAASTAGEEARNPQRDLPPAILLSLAIVTALYCLVALAAVGALPWQRFEHTDAPLTDIVTTVLGSPLWSAVLAIGAIVAISSVVLTVLYGQTRILFAMARDGLLPKALARVHPKTGSPRVNTVVVSAFVALLAGLVPLGKLADATSIGTLFAFGLVNVAVLLLRKRKPDARRSFRVPFAPVTPLLGVVCCGYLMVSLDLGTWLVFCGWMVLGLACYFGYGIRHSRMAAR